MIFNTKSIIKISIHIQRSAFVYENNQSERLASLSTILGVDRETPCPAKYRGFPKALGYILRKTKGIRRPFFRPL